MQKMPGSLQEQATPLPAQRKGEKRSEKLLSSENHDKVGNENEIQPRDKFLAELLAQGTSRDVALNKIGEQLCHLCPSPRLGWQVDGYVS